LEKWLTEATSGLNDGLGRVDECTDVVFTIEYEPDGTKESLVIDAFLVWLGQRTTIQLH